MLQQLEKIKSFWRKKSSVWFLTSGASTPAPVESGSGRCLYIQLRIIVQLRSHIFCFCCIITVALFFNFKNCSIVLNLCMLHCCFYLKNFNVMLDTRFITVSLERQMQSNTAILISKSNCFYFYSMQVCVFCNAYFLLSSILSDYSA